MMLEKGPLHSQLSGRIMAQQKQRALDSYKKGLNINQYVMSELKKN